MGRQVKISIIYNISEFELNEEEEDLLGKNPSADDLFDYLNENKMEVFDWIEEYEPEDVQIQVL